MITIRQILAIGTMVLLTRQICDETLCVCSGDQCESCLSQNFYERGNGSCGICNYNCLQCSSSDVCNSCMQGYFLEGDQCRQCPLFCRQCADATSCLGCIEGYYLNEDNQCRPCALANVKTCSSEMTVTSCLASYWKNGDSCFPCRQFCEQCTSSTNCLKCADGYRTQVSAGTYCVPCGTGCKTCTASACSACKKNYRLLSGSCVSMNDQCSKIEHCDECQFVSGSVGCKICSFPYYLAGGECVAGVSLCCQNGAMGTHRYQCLNGCGSGFTEIATIGSGSICVPLLWIPKTEITQYLLTPSNQYNTFVPVNMPIPACSLDDIIFSQVFSGSVNTLTFNRVLPPYYKLIFSARMLPLYKSVDPSLEISFEVVMSDNMSNSYQIGINTQQHTACTPFYESFQSRLVKDQTLRLDFKATLLNSSVGTSAFPNGLLGYSQFLIKLYRCSSQCRICSNTKYCLECYGQWFQYQNQCVDECFGFFQFYEPWGEVDNYTSKSCRQQCPEGFYSKLHPSKNNVYICSKCESPCKTCKSSSECLSCVQGYAYYDLAFSCVEDCPNTHYRNEKDICAPCNSPCLTCSNEAACLSCAIGYLNGQECLGVCPSGQYAHQLEKKCLNCEEKCLECSGSGSNCISCVNGYYLLGSACLGQCPQLTHYPDNETKVCQACKPPCLHCVDQTQCITCITGYLLDSSCLTECPTAYYKSLSTKTCENCSDNCAKCLSASICQSCVADTYLYNSGCVEDCPEKTYGSIEGVCLPCLPPCYTCNSSSFCLSCQIGYLSLVDPGKCIGICEMGFYPELVSGSLEQKQCKPCSQQCQTCKSFESCLSCANNSKVLSQNYSCIDECPVGSYVRNGACQSCSYPCESCVNRSSLCLSCELPYYLSGNQCVSQCGTTQYHLQQRKCLPCAYPCKSCQGGPQVCKSCAYAQQSSDPNATQTYLFGSECVEKCPEQTYPDSLTLKCKACVYPCLTCLTSKICLSCANGFLNPLKGLCQICPPGYYGNQTSKLCEKCSDVIDKCSQCTSAMACLSCEQDYYLFNSSCISEQSCKAIEGNYPNKQQMTCSECVSPCQRCSSQTSCISCSVGYLHNSKCLMQCPDGYYASSARTCQSCDKDICLLCSSSPTHCLRCDDSGSYPVLKVSQNSCIRQSECTDGFYIDNLYGYSRCLKCQNPCLTCSSPRVCQSCLTGILHNGECRYFCPKGYYEKTNTSVTECSPCSDQCLECRSQPSNCITCKEGSYLEGSSCVQSCSEGYYLDQNILECKQCHSPCGNCEMGSYCLSCQSPNDILYYGQCIGLCPDGTYKTNSSCEPCPEECQLCSAEDSDQVLCKKCSVGLYMNSSQIGTCEANCSQSEYPDNYTRSCYPCQAPCETCLSGTKCLTCQSGYLLYHTDCIRGAVCPEKTFKDQDQPRCLDRCPSPFFGDSFVHECLDECLYNHLKFPADSLCVSQCPKSYYLSIDKTCQKCSRNSCKSLLRMSLSAKSIFNVLYARISFTEDVDLQVLEGNPSGSILVEYTPVRYSEERRRMLESLDSTQIDFQIKEITSTNTLWLKLYPKQSLKSVQLLVSIKDYYTFSGKVLQHSNATTVLKSYDEYSSSQIEEGMRFETYSKVISIFMFLLFLANLIPNTGYLLYHMVDYYQILFILLFLNADYPPTLNYFLYGFRYAHYLFLPQIFDTGAVSTTAADTPAKFGIIVKDAKFLTNTGHDFLVIFTVLIVFGLFKIIECLTGDDDKKSNKIKNHPEGGQEQIQHNNENQGRENPSDSSSKKSEIESQSNQKQLDRGERVRRLARIALQRIIWNYLNDFISVLYFYLVMFAFVQTYEMGSGSDSAHYASTIFAVLFIILGVGWVLFLWIMLHIKNSKGELYEIKNHQSKEEMEGAGYIEKLQYKCFLWNARKSVPLALYLVPIRYTKKLLLAILFVFAGAYENFIIGVIIMSGVLTIAAYLVYRPFRNKLQLGLSCVFEAVFCLGCLGMCILMISDLELSPERKMSLAGAVVAIFVILSLLLLAYNIVMIVFQGFKYFKGKDYFSQFYYPQEDQLPQEETEGNSITEQSNMRLNVGRELDGDFKGIVKVGTNHFSEEGSDSSGLGIYLKKNSNTPQVLIKCVKGSRFAEDLSKEPEENSEQNSSERQEQIQNQPQNEKKNEVMEQVAQNSGKKSEISEGSIRNMGALEKDEIKEQWNKKQNIMGVIAIEEDQFAGKEHKEDSPHGNELEKKKE